MGYYQTAAFPKPEIRAVSKKRAQKQDAKDERTCRAATRKRDKGKCRIPGCIAKADHLHHLVYRSRSKRLRWLTQNCLWLCMDHHRLVHAGEIRITGNADEHIEVTGNIDLLRFRL